jgi:MYXO-CTERM domain-containing protein
LDTSGIIDGQSLDVHWYDPDGTEGNYFECNGDEVVDFLGSVAPPLCQGPTCAGIGTWTRGALEHAREIIGQTRTDHPNDDDPPNERSYFVLLMTDGLWSNPEGNLQGSPPEADPVEVAGELFSDDDTRVYVVAFGDAAGLSFADDVAFAGGTNDAIQADAGELVPALETVIQDISDNVIVPQCTEGLPRLMVVLDASSSMLNVGGVAGAMDQTGWDQAREALAGMMSLFDAPIAQLNNQPVEDLVQLGMLTFGLDGDQQILVNYGPCMKDNFAWALDPNTSCGPGCSDPWGGPPIIWSPQGPSSAGYPGFDQATHSIMPLCDVGQASPGACTGSGTATHTGLALASQNASDYRENPPALYPVGENTVFANILITDGQYNDLGEFGSTDEQVSAELIDMYENQNIQTFVIGFGAEISVPELQNMACWGSGGGDIPCTGGGTTHFTAANQAELQTVLQTIIASLNFDPCCAFNDCSFNPEPTTGEPDPVVPPESSTETSGETETAGTSGGSQTSGADDGDPTGADDGTGASQTAGATLSTTAASGVDGSDGTDSGSSGGADDDGGGCNCRTSGGDPRFGSLLGLFGLIAFRRRRRTGSTAATR